MVRNELEAQRTATEFALRKRIYEMERAKGELEWQEKKVINLFAVACLSSHNLQIRTSIEP